MNIKETLTENLPFPIATSLFICETSLKVVGGAISPYLTTTAIPYGAGALVRLNELKFLNLRKHFALITSSPFFFRDSPV